MKWNRFAVSAGSRVPCLNLFKHVAQALSGTLSFMKGGMLASVRASMRDNRYAHASVLILTVWLAATSQAQQASSRPNVGTGTTYELTPLPGMKDQRLQQGQQQSAIARKQTSLSESIETFIQQRVGYKEDEPIEVSELIDLLDAFERDKACIIPDRDVLECETLTAKELAVALDRRINKSPAGKDVEIPDLLNRIIPNHKPLRVMDLKPFQRRDIFNNPSKLIESIQVPGLTLTGFSDDSTPGSVFKLSGRGPDNATYYSVNGQEQFTGRTGRALPLDSRDLVAQAILSVRKDIGDPTVDSNFQRYAKYRKDRDRDTAGVPSQISKQDYADLVKRFLNGMKSNEDALQQMQAVQVALAQIGLESRTETYSNGKPRFDAQGRELYANGAHKYDLQGRPLYPNGKRKYDESGRSLHSNGQRKYSSNGSPLYANGRQKITGQGAVLYPDGSAKRTQLKGMPVFDNGRAMFDKRGDLQRVRKDQDRQKIEEANLPTSQVARPRLTVVNDPAPGEMEIKEFVGDRKDPLIPLDPKGQPKLRRDDGVKLHENQRPVVNDTGEPLHPNQGKVFTPIGGEQLYENGQRMENDRGVALGPRGNAITATPGFQGRPNGHFPIFAITEAKIVQADPKSVTLRLSGDDADRVFSLESVYIGSAGETRRPLADLKPMIGQSARVVTKTSVRYLDGDPLSASDIRLVSVFVPDNIPLGEVQGEHTVVDTLRGRVTSISDKTLVLRTDAGEVKEIAVADAVAQKTDPAGISPIAVRGLARGRTVEVIASTTQEIADSKAQLKEPWQAIAVWQDPR